MGFKFNIGDQIKVDGRRATGRIVGRGKGFDSEYDFYNVVWDNRFNGKMCVYYTKECEEVWSLHTPAPTPIDSIVKDHPQVKDEVKRLEEAIDKLNKTSNKNIATNSDYGMYGHETFYDDKILRHKDLILDKTNVDCDHDWQYYEGITQVYDFCTICDKKRSV